ncbi:snaclec 1-like isoform X2 [Mercenaria mercenaria]|uniref:snaclec 1-like isoform X2 n=1 Tax=Mercenaria mercenaria TaxID=6596 RepID=UPI00234F9609|nr:snaclec 1-like isoform X2 [Mercenaria mercenaria]
MLAKVSSVVTLVVIGTTILIGTWPVEIEGNRNFDGGYSETKTRRFLTTDHAVGCQNDGYVFDPPTNLCLKFYESPKYNWTDAQNYCNSSHGRLAIITGDQKIKDVLTFYKDGGYTSPLWVGATDFGNSHVFTFTDGSKLTFDPSEGKDLKDHNCLYVTGGSYKGFGPCTERHGFICEK